MNYNKVNNNNFKEVVYFHDFYLKKGLSYNQVGNIIGNFERDYNYDFKTGIFELNYIILKDIYGVTARILHIEIPLKKGLSKQEKNNIRMSVSFEYDTSTGIFRAIHKIKQ